MFTSETCDPYSIVDSSTADCGPINACPGDTVVVDNCDSCKGGSRLILNDASGVRVRSKEDICGVDRCSKVTFTVPGGAKCQEYTARQGCFANNNCSGTTFISVVPNTVVESFKPHAYLSIFSTSTCNGDTRGVTVLLDHCVRFTKHGSFAKFSCDSHTVDSSWTLKLYQSASCNSNELVGMAQHSGACGCSALSYDNGDDDNRADFLSAGLSLNCASTAAPANCDSYVQLDVQPPPLMFMSPLLTSLLASPQLLPFSYPISSITVTSLTLVSAAVLLGLCYFLYVVFCRSRKNSRPISPVARV